MRATLIILISTIFSTVNLYSSSTNISPLNEQNSSCFKDGEVLSFTIRYEWGLFKMDVGDAAAAVTIDKHYAKGEAVKATVAGSSFKFFDLIFKVRERFESHFNPISGRPYYFHRDVVEGKYTMKNWINFNKDYTIEATIARKQDPVRDTLLKGDKNTFDLVSLVYYIRNLNLSNFPEGIPHKASFVIDGEIHDIFYTFLGREVKKVPGLGQFNTLKFSTKLIVGEVFTGKEEMLLWVSDDSSKVLLLFETPIIVGKVIGRLKEYENLKYQLSSKIDERKRD